MTKELLELDVEHHLRLYVEALIGRSTAVLGITGSGKSNTAAVLIEELLANDLPLTIVDIEGEYWGLKERFELLIAGRSAHAEVPLEVGNAAALAEISLARRISVILDLSEYTQEESSEILFSYFTRIWEIAGQKRKPYHIVLEEAHEWIPQGVRTPLKQVLTRIALRGRKRGLGIILMSQRSAKVEKDVLTQSSLLFLHKVVHPIDTKIYKDLIPLPGAEVEQLVSGLQSGQAVVVNNHTAQVVQIRLRTTFHGGTTPTLEEVIQPELRRVDASLLQELQQLLAVKASSKESEGDALRKAEQRINELEQLLTARDAEIARQAEQIALLSQLRVSIDGAAPSLTLPDRLSIEEATIEQATIHRLHGLQPSAVVEASLKPVSLSQSLTTSINKAKIESLQTRIRQLSETQCQVFKILVEHSTPMTLDRIADWMNVSKSTVQRNVPPDAFMRMGLVQRTQDGNAHVYRSLLKEYLAKEFPGADQEALLRQLLPA